MRVSFKLNIIYVSRYIIQGELLMAETIQLKGKVDQDLWEQLTQKFPNLEEETLLNKVLNQYLNLIDLEVDGENIVNELTEQRKLAESLRKKCKNFALRVKELEDYQGDQEGEIEKL